jgi:hypothetical protein
MFREDVSHEFVESFEGRGLIDEELAGIEGLNRVKWTYHSALSGAEDASVGVVFWFATVRQLASPLRNNFCEGRRTTTPRPRYAT